MSPMQTCPLHGRPLICLACHLARAGRACAAKKGAEERADQARRAAQARWGRVKKDTPPRTD